MADTTYVNVLNRQGRVIDTKPRADVDRRRDILPAVYVFVKPSPGALLVATIPDDAYGARGTYVGKRGFPVATFVRADEEPFAAAKRALQKDLAISVGDLTLLSQGYTVFSDGLRRHVWVYVVQHSGPFVADAFAASKLEIITVEAVREECKAHPEQFAPSFIEFLPLLSDL